MTGQTRARTWLSAAALVVLVHVAAAGVSASAQAGHNGAGRVSSSLLQKAAHWQPVRVSDGGAGKPAPEDYREIQFTDAEHGWLLAHTNPKVVNVAGLGSAVTYAGGVLLGTTDGGASWRPVYRTTAPASSFHFLNSQVGWLAFDEGGTPATARTRDGGRTWTKTVTQGEGPEQICAVSDREAWGIVDGGLYPIHTVDGGASWSEVKLPPGAGQGEYKQYKQVLFLDRQHGWIVGEGARQRRTAQVLRTRDGGKTFQVAHTPAIPFHSAFSSYRLRFINPDEGWLTFEGTLLHTLDGGATWRIMDAAAASSMTSIVDCFFANHGDGWAVGQSSSPLALRTRDGGRTWAREQTGAESIQFGMLKRVVFTDTTHGWVIGQGGTPPPMGEPNAGHMIQFVLKYVP